MHEVEIQSARQSAALHSLSVPKVPRFELPMLQPSDAYKDQKRTRMTHVLQGDGG